MIDKFVTVLYYPEGESVVHDENGNTSRIPHQEIAGRIVKAVNHSLQNHGLAGLALPASTDPDREYQWRLEMVSAQPHSVAVKALQQLADMPIGTEAHIYREIAEKALQEINGVSVKFDPSQIKLF